MTSMLDAQQIVFSHRVYALQGRSYQQLWIWSADAGTLTQISRAARDHFFPTCESDGRAILFDSESGLTLGGHPKPAIDRQLKTGHFR
jgi:Tol biopolymer transport system component